MLNPFPWFSFVEMFLFEVEEPSRKKIPCQLLISVRSATAAVSNSYNVNTIPHPIGQVCSGSHLLGKHCSVFKTLQDVAVKKMMRYSHFYIKRRKRYIYLHNCKERLLLIACCHYTSLQGENIGVQEGKRKRTLFFLTKLLPLNRTLTSDIFKLWF